MNWIKVEDQKPEEGQTVFSWSTQGMKVCIYRKELVLFWKSSGEPKFCNLMSKWLFVDEFVTHWMPIPKPPMENVVKT